MLPRQPVKLSIWTKVYKMVENYSINISVKIHSIITNETAEIANLHFSHYKAAETLSYQSNESSWTLKIKKNVEDNVRSKYAKFQLHPPYGSWEEFWIVFRKFTPYVALATNQIKRFGQ